MDELIWTVIPSAIPGNEGWSTLFVTDGEHHVYQWIWIEILEVNFWPILSEIVRYAKFRLDEERSL